MNLKRIFTRGKSKVVIVWKRVQFTSIYHDSIRVVIELRSTRFSTLIHLFRGSQSTYTCFPWVSFTKLDIHYSFQATDCFPTKPWSSKEWSSMKKKSIQSRNCIDFRQSLEQTSPHWGLKSVASPCECYRRHYWGLAFKFYSIDTHFNSTTTDCFWKHCGKRRNCS